MSWDFGDNDPADPEQNWEEDDFSCCGDILTEDGFCHTCWEHCK